MGTALARRTGRARAGTERGAAARGALARADDSVVGALSTAAPVYALREQSLAHLTGGESTANITAQTTAL